MAIATRPKPKVQHRKRQARHHRQTKHYLKPYWPYLPLFALLGGAAVLNRAWYHSGLFAGAADPYNTRVEALTGSAWSLVVVILIAGMACGIFLFRHAYRLQRALNRGEAFIVHHPWFDVTLVGIIAAGVLLSRSVLP